MLKNIILSFSIASSIILLSGCQIKKHQGDYISKQTIEEINKAINSKNNSKENIYEIAGEPSIKKDNNWLYIYRQMGKRAFFSYNLLEQQIVKVSFSQNHAINVSVSNEKPKNINIKKYSTFPNVVKYNQWKHFTKNFGRKAKKNKPKSNF